MLAVDKQIMYERLPISGLYEESGMEKTLPLNQHEWKSLVKRRAIKYARVMCAA